MIIKTKVTAGEIELTHVCSDKRYMLIRSDGKRVSSDMYVEEKYTYEETDEIIGEVQDYETAAKILLGMEV